MALWQICLMLLCTSILAAPVDESKSEITQYEFVPNIGDGSYNFRYETSNGISREESGTKRIGKDDKEFIFVKGFYSYYSDQGKVKVNYEADENGYRQTTDEDLPIEVQHFPAAALASLVGGGLGK